MEVHKLLVSGERDSFSLLRFSPADSQLSIIVNYPAPYNASWVESIVGSGDIDTLIGLSEGEEAGSIYSFEIDHSQRTCRTLSSQPTRGAPAHFIYLRDKSAVVVATYMGGSIALFPITESPTQNSIGIGRLQCEVFPKFPYSPNGHGPIKHRQEQCHIHQLLEDKRGMLYALDLGSDRIWIFQRNEHQLEERGSLKCPAGTGPRHAVLSPDESMMYVLGELSHTVLAFELSASMAGEIDPIGGFAPNIISSAIHPKFHTGMDAAEICLHPYIPNVLYASNRWAKHNLGQQAGKLNSSEDKVMGDDIAVILLSKDGSAVEAVEHVRTNVDVIRGMRLSHDGRYVAAVGQESGGLEIYRIDGERGNSWKLVAKITEGLEGHPKHIVWL